MSPGRVDAIAGVERREAFWADDERGRFVKLHSDGDPRFAPVEWAEVYYSSSDEGVVRGMHLQRPPHDHHKAVHCLTGRAVDVVVDLRLDSPTVGAHVAFELEASRPELVVIPPGCAHGFQALEAGTTMVYLVSTVHAPASDGGVRWDSFGAEWPRPISSVSPRDAALPTVDEFLAEGIHGWAT